MLRKLLLCIPFLYLSLTSAQDKMDDVVETYLQKVDSVEKQTISTKYLFNKGLLSEDILSQFTEFKKNKEDGFTVISPKHFKFLYRRIRRSDLKRPKRLPKVDFDELKATYKTKKNIVPLGIVQVQGQLLDSAQIEDNIKMKREGISIKDKYDKTPIFAASILKKKVYSGKVKFKVLPELFHLGNPNKVKSISIDFYDGQGFRALTATSKFNITYEDAGEHPIAIKFLWNKKEFISYSTIKVVTTNDEVPDRTFELSSETDQSSNTSGKSISNSASARPPTSGLSGGNASLFAGCDRIFDKPVIIVEGFDARNEESIADVRAKYRAANIEQIFRANGHDVIYLNFGKGGDDIRKNANVLQNLIQDVNRQKTGTSPNIVIGESMGGLVARLAITNMERSRRTHNISHFISFDSPHKGANVPVGYQTFLDDLNAIDALNLFNAYQSEIKEGLDLINAKAAKQMLLRYRGASPHPDFTSLQNELDSKGFPSREGIRNIAIVNGAIDGSIGDAGLFRGPGTQILSIQGNIIVLNGHARARTNALNSRTQVSSILIATLGIPTTIRQRSFNFNAFNYDMSAGGTFIVDEFIADIALDTENFNQDFFSFVPLFSSLASTAPINNQGQLNRSEAQLRGNNWTPFDRIFGTNDNTEHVSTTQIQGAWDDLLRFELGLTLRTSGCTEAISSANPPTPRMNTDYYYTCQNGTSRTMRIDNLSSIAGLYNHSWRVTGPRNFTRTGDYMTMSSYMPTGVYSIRLTRSFRGGQGLVGGSVSTTRVFTIFRQGDSRYCGNQPPDTRLQIDMAGFLVEQESLNPSLETVLFPNPVRGHVNINYELPVDSKVSISLISAIGLSSKPIILYEGDKSKGEHLDTFQVGEVPDGVYVLIIDTGNKITKKKVIVKK